MVQKLHQVPSTSGYVYDGDGKRVEKTSSGSAYKLYWYDKDGNILDETDGSGNLQNEYVFLDGNRIARRDSSSNIFYYFADHLGTSREIVQSGSTSPCYDADFYPFGGERTPYTNSCSTTNNYKFTGKERDTESNLDNFGARYDSSQLGRFMSPDWSKNPEGVPYADFTDPQSLNLYSYARNNPSTQIDKNGHCLEDFCIGEALIAARVIAAAVTAYEAYKAYKWVSSKTGAAAAAQEKKEQIAFDDVVHPNEHLDKDINAQTKDIQNSTLDPTKQAKDTLQGISAGAGLVGVMPEGAIGGTAEKILGAAVDANTEAVGDTADIASRSRQNFNVPGNAIQAQPPKPSPGTDPTDFGCGKRGEVSCAAGDHSM